MKSFYLLSLFLILILKTNSITISEKNENANNTGAHSLNNSKETEEILRNNRNSNLKNLKFQNNSNKIIDELDKMRFKSTSNIKLQSQTLMNTKAKDDPSALWSQLFTQQRESICREKAFTQTSQTTAQEIKNGERVYKGTFPWIKKWGYGPTAYLIDYLDPIFLNDIVFDFKKIYSELSAFSNKDNDLYEDVLSLKKLDPTGKITDLKKLNPNYESGIYEHSINSVQVNYAMTTWNWYHEKNKNSAKQFILDYDINGDGRLTPRELFLGLIVNHKSKNLLCYNCLLLVKKKISAMFEYFDCAGNGYINSEILWQLLPNLTRNETRWNIFSINNKNNIRSDCVNDFIIKNGLTKPGYVSKDEFVNGILLAYWDRQTNDKGVVDSDVRNLKSLRWKENGTIDTVAFEYMKEKELQEKIAEQEKQEMKNKLAEYNEKR